MGTAMSRKYLTMPIRIPDFLKKQLLYYAAEKKVSMARAATILLYKALKDTVDLQTFLSVHGIVRTEITRQIGTPLWPRLGIVWTPFIRGEVDGYALSFDQSLTQVAVTLIYSEIGKPMSPEEFFSLDKELDLEIRNFKEV